MATINDIAAKLGISKSTVSKGLNNATDISDEMRRRILETAVEVGYINKRAQKHEKKLCIFVANMEYDTPNQFAHDIIRCPYLTQFLTGILVEVICSEVVVVIVD